MNFLTLLFLIVVVTVVAFVIRGIIHAFKRPRFPVFSIVMLSISLIMVVAGTILSLVVSDAIGTAVSTIGGFFSLFESHVRHKREAQEEASAASLPEN